MLVKKSQKHRKLEGTKHTLSPAIELYADLLVHVFIQIEDVFLLGLFLLLSTATTATFSMAATAARAIISSAAAATTSTERASFGHGLARSEISDDDQKDVPIPTCFS